MGIIFAKKRCDFLTQNNLLKDVFNALFKDDFQTMFTHVTKRQTNQRFSNVNIDIDKKKDQQGSGEQKTF